MSKNYGIDDGFLQKVKDSVGAAIKEKNHLTDEERGEAIDAYKEYVAEQMTLEREARTLFVDKYGATICLMITPEKEYKNGILSNRPEESKNGSFRLWGYNLPLLGEYNKITYFSETQEGMIGYARKALVRGVMTLKYKGKESDEFPKFEKPFIRDMKKIYKEDYPDIEVNGLEDIYIDDYFKNYTFNYWETLILWKKEAK